MASRQVTFAPRKVVIALAFSFVMHGSLFLAGILARNERTTSKSITIDCRVPDGPGLLLDLTHGSDSKRKREGAEEAQDLIPVKVEPLRSIGSEGSSSPLVNQPAASGPSNAVGHRDGGGGGKGASLYGIPIKSRRVVFVLDRSLSMGLTRAFTRAQDELLRCLRALPEETSFQVVLYNRATESLSGNRLHPISAVTVEEVDKWLNETVPEGATDHIRALSAALSFEPDAIFLVTDADDLTSVQVRELTRLNRTKATLHTIDVSRRLRAASMLESLSLQNGGRHIRAMGR